MHHDQPYVRLPSTSYRIDGKTPSFSINTVESNDYDHQSIHIYINHSVQTASQPTTYIRPTRQQLEKAAAVLTAGHHTAQFLMNLHIQFA